MPRVIQWLQDHPLGIPIRFVTNFHDPWAPRIRNVLPITDPHEVIRWSQRVQEETMKGAKVAFDIKGVDFTQMHKPPLKAQQFIASGIPFATNPECYSAEYFRRRGFRVPSLTDTAEWFSRDYWERTQAVGARLRRRLTLERIGLDFKQVFDGLLEA